MIVEKHSRAPEKVFGLCAYQDLLEKKSTEISKLLNAIICFQITTYINVAKCTYALSSYTDGIRTLLCFKAFSIIILFVTVSLYFRTAHGLI